MARSVRSLSCLGRACWLMLAITFVMIVIPGPALADQQQDANLYAFFSWNGSPFQQNLDQMLMVRQKAQFSYWAMIWKMDHSNSSGGYMGLQTDGNRFDGSRGDTAIFSIWGSIGHAGPSCGQFPYESGGTGFSCRVSYPIKTGTWYRLRVWKLSADAKSVWWGAWVQDQTTGMETLIGKLQVSAAQTTLSGHANFSEYFGDAVASPELVPQSTVYWSAPGADQVSPGEYRFNSAFKNSTKAKGTTGSVTNIDNVDGPKAPVKAVRIIQGGRDLSLK